MKRILIGLVVIVVLCGVVAGGAFFLAGNALKGLSDTGNNFMAALRDGDYETAYNLSSTDLQAQIGDVDAIKSNIEGGNAQPQTWNFNSINVENNIGQMSGTGVFANGETAPITLGLILEGDQWKILAFNFGEG
jgi:hypothetical protein